MLRQWIGASFVASLLVFGPSAIGQEGVTAEPQLTPAPHVIAGFRSARFGSTEDEVRDAIKRDFGSVELETATSEAERTTFLFFRDAVLAPDTPPATVFFIFGYKTKRLIQVNVIWGEGKGFPVAELYPFSKTLATYFNRLGSYVDGSVAIEQRQVDGSITAFQAKDAKGAMISLRVLPYVDPAAASELDKAEPIQVDQIVLRLSYVENPDRPDIFYIDQGLF
jgi:hypothetical protein